MHPRLIRRFFQYLQQLARTNQVFVVTYSPWVVDLAPIDTLYPVTRRVGEAGVPEAQLSRLSQAELEPILIENELRLSSLLFADAVVVTDTAADAALLQKLIEKEVVARGMLASIPVVSVEGHYESITALCTALSAAGVPVVVALFAPPEEVSAKVPEQPLMRRFFIPGGGFEVHVPRSLLLNMARELGEQLQEGWLLKGDIRTIQEQGLRRPPTRTVLARRIAARATYKQVSRDLRDVVDAALELAATVEP